MTKSDKIIRSMALQIAQGARLYNCEDICPLEFICDGESVNDNTCADAIVKYYKESES